MPERTSQTWALGLITAALAVRLAVFIASFWADSFRLLASINSPAILLGSVGLTWLLFTATSRSRVWSRVLVLATLAAVSFDVVAVVKLATESGSYGVGDRYEWAAMASIFMGTAFAFGLVAAPIERRTLRPLLAVLITAGIALGCVGLAASATNLEFWFELAGTPIGLALATAATRWERVRPA